MMTDINRFQGLILDFDGPVCDVFAKMTLPMAAAMVRSRSGAKTRAADPFDVLHEVRADPSIGDPDLVADVLEIVEGLALRSAAAAPGGLELIRRWWGRPLAVVSNNAKWPIDGWLRRQGVRPAVHHVRGRTIGRMKPDPWPLDLAAKAIGVSPTNCLYVGDALTDGEAAEAAGMAFLALATTASRQAEFLDQGIAAEVVGSMLDLLQPVDVASTKVPVKG